MIYLLILYPLTVVLGIITGLALVFAVFWGARNSGKIAKIVFGGRLCTLDDLERLQSELETHGFEVSQPKKETRGPDLGGYG